MHVPGRAWQQPCAHECMQPFESSMQALRQWLERYAVVQIRRVGATDLARFLRQMIGDAPGHGGGVFFRPIQCGEDGEGADLADVLDAVERHIRHQQRGGLGAVDEAFACPDVGAP
jgi:hypothetical protein